MKEDRKKKRKKRKQRSVTDSDESDSKEKSRTEKRSRHRNRSHKHDKKRSTSESHKSNKGHRRRRSHTDTSSVPDNKDTVSGSRIISSGKSSKVVDDDAIVESRGPDHQHGSRSHSRHDKSRGTRGSCHRKEKDEDVNREEKRLQGSTLDELHERFKKQRETDHRQQQRHGSSEQ